MEMLKHQSEIKQSLEPMKGRQDQSEERNKRLQGPEAAVAAAEVSAEAVPSEGIAAAAGSPFSATAGSAAGSAPAVSEAGGGGTGLEGGVALPAMPFGSRPTSVLTTNFGSRPSSQTLSHRVRYSGGLRSDTLYLVRVRHSGGCDLIHTLCGMRERPSPPP